jgi:hypothetical protein
MNAFTHPTRSASASVTTQRQRATASCQVVQRQPRGAAPAAEPANPHDHRLAAGRPRVASGSIPLLRRPPPKAAAPCLTRNTPTQIRNGACWGLEAITARSKSRSPSCGPGLTYRGTVLSSPTSAPSAPAGGAFLNERLRDDRPTTRPFRCALTAGLGRRLGSRSLALAMRRHAQEGRRGDPKWTEPSR